VFLHQDMKYTTNHAYNSHSQFYTHTHAHILIISSTHEHLYATCIINFIFWWTVHTHTWCVYHKHQIENVTSVFPVVQNIFESLLQYLGVFLWILYRLLWGYTTLTVSVFVLCLYSVSQTVCQLLCYFWSVAYTECLKSSNLFLGSSW
jgi:hypothetical protein